MNQVRDRVQESEAWDRSGTWLCRAYGPAVGWHLRSVSRRGDQSNRRSRTVRNNDCSGKELARCTTRLIEKHGKRA